MKVPHAHKVISSSSYEVTVYGLCSSSYTTGTSVFPEQHWDSDWAVEGVEVQVEHGASSRSVFFFSAVVLGYSLLVARGSWTVFFLWKLLLHLKHRLTCVACFTVNDDAC